MTTQQTGVKRKREVDDLLVGPYPVQRQSVLNMSLIKLSSGCTATRREPSLRRSVLIFNTLRRIEAELVQDGGKLHACSTPASILPSIESGDDLTLDAISQDSVVAGWTPSAGRSMCARLRDNTVDKSVSESPAQTQPHVDMDVLTDLDMSLFDLDLIAPLTSSVKLTQLSAEELVHTLPSSEASFSALGPPAACNYKHELLGDDLDHIMQVLVGI